MENEKLDLIDRKEISEMISSLTMTITGLRAGKGVLNKFMTEYRKSILRIIDEAPTVDAVPVVHGRWEKEDQSGISIDGYMVCSACNVMIPKPDYNRYCLHRLNFCPNCGADMRGDRDGRKDP